MTQMELQKKLGERIENLSRNDLTPEEFTREIERSKAMASVAKEFVRSITISVQAMKHVGSLTSGAVEELIG